MSDIKSGYYLTLTSWENDGDHYKNITFDGLTKQDAAFIIDLAKLFRSNSLHNGGFGGSKRHYEYNNKGHDYWEDLTAAWNAVIEKHPDISKDVRENFAIQDDEDDNDHDFLSETITQLVSYPGEDYDEVYNRVFASFKVHYFLETVIDVTQMF